MKSMNNNVTVHKYNTKTSLCIHFKMTLTHHISTNRIISFHKNLPLLLVMVKNGCIEYEKIPPLVHWHPTHSASPNRIRSICVCVFVHSSSTAAGAAFKTRFSSEREDNRFSCIAGEEQQQLIVICECTQIRFGVVVVVMVDSMDGLYRLYFPIVASQQRTVGDRPQTSTPKYNSRREEQNKKKSNKRWNKNSCDVANLCFCWLLRFVGRCCRFVIAVVIAWSNVSALPSVWWCLVWWETRWMFWSQIECLFDSTDVTNVTYLMYEYNNIHFPLCLRCSPERQNQALSFSILCLKYDFVSSDRNQK